MKDTPLVIASAIQGQVSQPHQAADVRVVPFDFAATEITLEAATEKGRAFFAAMFGAGAASVNMKKSAAFDFERFAGQKGLVVG